MDNIKRPSCRLCICRMAAAFALAAVPLVGAGVAAARAQPFAERFASPRPGPRWKFAGPAGHEKALVWTSDALSARTARGFRFDAREGFRMAYAEWPVGTDAFELTWGQVFDGGFAENWRKPGVYVALSSALPDRMTGEDLAVLIASCREGPSAQVTTRGLFTPNKVALHKHCKAYQAFVDRSPAPRHALNKGGEGGVNYSLIWPVFELTGLRLRMRLERSVDNVLKYTMSRVFKDGSAALWHERTWKMTPAVAQVPLKYLIVATTLNSNEYNPATPPDPKGRYQHYPRGLVYAIQARRLRTAHDDGPDRPRVTGFASRRPALGGGSSVTILGEAFEKGARVAIGASPPVRARFISGTKLEVRLPDMPEGRSHPLAVVNPTGLFGSLPGGLPYGRVLTRVEPCEASPDGGEVVTLVGGGFSKATRITFNGEAARIVELVDSAHVRVRVPAGAAGLARVAARDGGSTFTGEPRFGYAPHPYLAFKADELAALRRKFRAPAFKHYRAQILRGAGGESGLEGTGDVNTLSAAVSALSWAYVLSGEEECKEKLLAVAERICREPNTLDFHSMVMTSMAQAYDMLFPELTPGQRIMFQRYLDFVLDDYLNRVRRNLWFLSNDSNTNPVSNCGGGLVALALMHSRADSLAAAKKAAKYVQNYARTVLAPDGACVEGTLYWDYGLTYYVILGHALKSATGDDMGALSHPNFARNARFAQAVLAGDGMMFPWNDSQPWLAGGAVLAYFDRTENDPLCRWLADRIAEAYGKKDINPNTRQQFFPYMFLWRTRTRAGAFPGVPVVSVLDETMWGVMRTDGAYIPRAVVGVKGQEGHLTHHRQADLGSFTLYAGGEPYLIDPGYYQGEADAHTLPLIDGAGPSPRGGSSIVDHGSKGDLRWMVVDSTRAYGRKAKRVRRTLVMRDLQVVVLDDILPADGAPGKVVAQYQAGRKAEIGADATSATIMGRKGKVLLQVFGPRIRLQTRGPRDFGRSWVFKEMADKGEVEWYPITGEYAADAADPLVTVLTPMAAADRPPSVEVRCSREKRGGKTIEVRRGGRRIVGFVLEADGWALAAP